MSITELEPQVRPEDKESPEGPNWRCFECGNDTDEFGNKL